MQILATHSRQGLPSVYGNVQAGRILRLKKTCLWKALPLKSREGHTAQAPSLMGTRPLRMWPEPELSLASVNKHQGPATKANDIQMPLMAGLCQHRSGLFESTAAPEVDRLYCDPE